MTDYSKVIIDDHTQQLFDRFRNCDEAEFTKAEFEVLKNTGLILPDLGGSTGWYGSPPDNGLCRISDYGKSFRVYQLHQQVKEKRDRLRFWVPIIISNVIALTALAISIIALTN